MTYRQFLFLTSITMASLLSYSSCQQLPHARAADAPEKYALLVAVAKYNHAAMNKPPLEFPEVDAADLAKVLRDSGYTVDLLIGSNATQQAIRDKLGGLKQRGNDAGVVLIGLFGHGVEYEKDQTAYYCPFDTTIREVKDSQGRIVYGNDKQPLIEPEPDRLIAMTELLTALRLCPAGNKAMLADCCRNSPNRPRGRAFGARLQLQDVPENTAILFACSANEQAFESRDWGHGAFTKVLLDEITAMSQSGSVTMGALADRVKPKVMELVKSQGGRDTQTPRSFISDTVDLQLKPVVTALVKSFTNSLGMELVLIPAGNYRRGSSDADVAAAVKADADFKAEYARDEQPQHRVQITKPFYMARHETTQGDFQKLLKRNTATFRAGGNYADRVSGLATTQFPMENVTWYDAIEFCNALSRAENKSLCYEVTEIERHSDESIKQATVRIVSGNGYRLPTEAEWEYACRAGTTTAFHFGNVLNGDKANVDGNYPFGTTTKGPSLRRTAKVGSYSSNAFGLFDMHGNVWEWCQDGYDENAYATYANQDAVDPAVGLSVQYRVLRGGSWVINPRSSRSAFRSWITPDYRDYSSGFRVVCVSGPRT